jgi:hypothetical protein
MIQLSEKAACDKCTNTKVSREACAQKENAEQQPRREAKRKDVA